MFLTISYSCQPFTIEVIPGKGKGLIANRKLKLGDKILTESPLILINNSDSEDFISWCSQVVTKVKQLSSEKLKKYLSLADNECFNKTSEFLYLKGVKKFRNGHLNHTKTKSKGCLQEGRKICNQDKIQFFELK